MYKDSCDMYKEQKEMELCGFCVSKKDKLLKIAESDYERTLANIINDVDINKNMQIAEKEYEQKLSEGD